MSTPGTRSVALTVLVAALGYFVDIYDLILFLVLRVKSLRGIGVPDAALLRTGVLLLNVQMVGMLLGGVAWGVLGDRRGRLSVLFGSIFLYSIANLANAFVTSVPAYAGLRFVAGFGLAGELGAGVTLVSEIMGREQRGWGTTVVAGVGLCGAIVAALVGGRFEWRTAYLVGGGLGLSLLALRLGLRESGIFETACAAGVRRGEFLGLFTPASRARRYLGVVLVGVPIWFCLAVLVGLVPELAAAMGLAARPDPARAVLLFYVGASLGDFASGFLSQVARSRKRILALFLALTACSVTAYFTWGRTSLGALEVTVVALGASTGYWAVFVTVASEQFGTNLRATATTTAPNFVRGSVVPVTWAFQALAVHVGVARSAAVVGAATLLVAAGSLLTLEETFGKDLDYVEE